MRIPWGAGVVSDATKLKETCTGSNVYELIPIIRLTDTFANLDNWTETDTTGKVNIVAGGLELDGNNAVGQTGVQLTSALGRKVTKISITFIVPTVATNSLEFDFKNTTGLRTSLSAGQNLCTLQSGTINLFDGSISNVGDPIGIWAGATTYILNIYINKSTDGTWRKAIWTIEGGIYNTETILSVDNLLQTEIATTWYFSIMRYLSSPTNKALVSQVKIYYDYATDSPYVLYTADAGTGKTINGLDFTNLALPSGVVDTNLEFDYSFDDGTPSYSSKYSLTNLKALGAIAGSKRYLRMRVYQNSNGETQTYGAIVNADDAVTSVGAGASAPGAPTLTGYATGKYANLSWTMAATSVTYDIEIDGTVYTGYTSLSAEIAMARANTEYSFRVRGVNATGNGAWSTAITVKTEQVADDETIALAGSAVLSSVEDLTGTLHIAQGMTGAKIFDPIILPSAISQETFEYYVKDVLYNQGRNVL